MRNENRRKGLYMLLAILAACAIWFFVDESSNNGSPRLCQVEITDIPIEYVKESELGDRGLMLLKEGSSSTVDLTLEGTRRLIAQLDRSKIRLTADLSGVDRAGAQSITYKVNYTDWKFSGDAIDIKARSISMATVNVSELNSRVVDVRCELNGNVADGFTAGQLQLSHETIEIRGQAKDIDPVSYAKLTLDIGKNVEQSITRTLVCQFYDENDQLLDSKGIMPTVEHIQVKLPVFVTKELRLVVNLKEAEGASLRNVDYEISPATITVSGDASKLKDVETITLGNIDLLELVNGGASNHTYPIIIPEGCQNLSGVTRATMRIEFKDMVHTRIPATQFQYKHAPKQKEIEVLTDSLPIKVFGTSEDVWAVDAEDIIITADLSDYSSAVGTYTVPVTPEIRTSGDVGISGTYEVQISIREPEPEAEPESQGEAETESEPVPAE